MSAMPDHNPGIIIIEIEYFGEQCTERISVHSSSCPASNPGSSVTDSFHVSIYFHVEYFVRHVKCFALLKRSLYNFSYTRICNYPAWRIRCWAQLRYRRTPRLRRFQLASCEQHKTYILRCRDVIGIDYFSISS